MYPDEGIPLFHYKDVAGLMMKTYSWDTLEELEKFIEEYKKSARQDYEQQQEDKAFGTRYY